MNFPEHILFTRWSGLFTYGRHEFLIWQRVAELSSVTWLHLFSLLSASISRALNAGRNSELNISCLTICLQLQLWIGPVSTYINILFHLYNRHRWNYYLSLCFSQKKTVFHFCMTAFFWRCFFSSQVDNRLGKERVIVTESHWLFYKKMSQFYCIMSQMCYKIFWPLYN